MKAHYSPMKDKPKVSRESNKKGGKPAAILTDSELEEINKKTRFAKMQT